MAHMLHLELTQEATPLERLAGDVRATAARLDLVGRVAEAPDPTDALLFLPSGLMVKVGRPFVSGEDPFVADFGMARAATVDFTFDSSGDFDLQVDELLELLVGLLAVVPGDAVLHYEFAEVWLVRRAGAFVLSDDDEIWPPERLARIDVPYDRSHLAFVTM
jgi:hypothetical protein